MSKSPEPKQEFSKLRQALFPIHNEEFKKFLPIAFIMLCILFNYTVLRNTKDALIGTAAGAGVEAIPYLKSIFVMSSAIAFVVMYTKLSNMFSAERLFYILTAAFLLFFGAFAVVIYPNIDILHPNIQSVEALQAEYPRVKFLFSVWAVWTYSLFYVMSELWGSVMISLLFWAFCNEIVRSNEAKRFYPMFVLIGNIALIFSGTAVKTLSDIRESLPADVDAWGVSLDYLMGMVVIIGVACMFTYRWMHKNVLTDPKYYDAAEPKKAKKSKPKMGVVDSFKYIFTNPYIGLIALLVLSYGMSINLVELIWKKQIAIEFSGNPNGYNAFMGTFSTWTGIGTIAIIFLTKGVVNRFGWFVGAIITPLVLAVTGALFFGLILFNDVINPAMFGLAVSATYMAMIVGLVQNILTKGSKYALFDPTKEMSYIPLDQELKTKGKAVVDVIGGRLGKAAGGWTILILFTLFSATDAMDVAPYLGYFIGAVVIAWIMGVIALSKRYNALTKRREELEADEKTSA